MRHGLVVLFATAVVLSGMDLSAEGAPTAVRPEGAVRALVAKGLERSATFRNLVRRLDATDVVVYVRFSRCTGVPACLLWASAGPRVRMLVARLDRFGHSDDELIALLAHELQHAYEVASGPATTDAASFGRWFATRGWKGAHGFETAEAQDVSRKVSAELIRAAGL